MKEKTEENKTNNEEMKKKINEQVEEKINSILTEGVKQTNIDYLGKLVDIHKDFATEDYYERKLDNMRYSNYGTYGDDMSYGRGRRRDSRGRYMERSGRGMNRGSYGHEYLDEMSEHYGRYSEGREQGRRGNYGAKEDSMKALEYMLESVEDFFEMLFEEAEGPEEIKMIKKTAKKIAEM